MNGKRSRLVTIAAAGSVAAATALSAVALTLPSASSADAQLLDVNQPQASQGYPMSASMQEAQLIQLRYTLGAHQPVHDNHAAQEAANKAAAAKAATSRAAAKAASARQHAAQQAARQKAAASAPSGSPQQIAQQMLGQFGWSASQFSYLQPLWEHESGWSVSAANPGSGAYGIPQALPGSRMASAGPDWQTNPATQIRWGLEYIKTTYGSPAAAWAHEQADGWY